MTDDHLEHLGELALIELRIVFAVRKIREHWHELLDMPEGARSGTPSTDTLTALERRLTLRQDVARVLAQVCRLVIVGRPLRTVRIVRSAPVERMLSLVETQAQWISGHEDAETVASRLERWARNVELTARPPQRDHVLLGDCPFLVPVEPDPDDVPPAGWPASLAGWPRATSAPCYGRVQARIGGDGSASCTGCHQSAVIEWWEDVLGLNLRPVTLPNLVPILHARLGLRVTDRTLRNWRRAGLIVPLPEPGDAARADELGPRPQWDRFSPREVIARASDMGRACVLCGKPWQGGGDVCRACWVSTSNAQPERAVEDDRPHIAGVPVTLRPRVLRPDPVADPHDDDRPERCHWSDLPVGQCACGRHA